MEQHAQIVVSGKTYPLRKQLKQAGLQWNGQAWAGNLPLDIIGKLKQFCRRYNLQYTIEGNNIKETRLPRATPPSTNSDVAAFMGEGKIQWEIKETLDIENLRSRKRQPKAEGRK